MKTLLILALALCSVVALADDIPTLNLLEIGQKGAKFYEGKVLKITFGWQQDGLIFAANARQKGGVKVVIPDAGAQWFASLPTKETKSSTQFVYLKVSPGPNGHEAFEAVGKVLKDGQPGW